MCSAVLISITSSDSSVSCEDDMVRYSGDRIRALASHLVVGVLTTLLEVLDD